MDNEKAEIPRLESEISREAYAELTKLMLENYWLEEKTPAVSDLYSLCDDSEQQKLVVDLLRRFTFLTGREVNRYALMIAEHVVKIFGFTPVNTQIVAICNDKNADGSQLLLQILKDKFAEWDGWKERNFINSLAVSANEVPNKSNVVIIDDFIGTGRKVCRLTEWYKQQLISRSIQCNIKVCALAGMEFSRVNLDKYDLEYYLPLWLKKGISDFYEPQAIPQKIREIKLLEDKLHPNYKKKQLDHMGYRCSETLFKIETCNVPNNVFPIFWWPLLKGKAERRTIFRRLR